VVTRSLVFGILEALRVTCLGSGRARVGDATSPPKQEIVTLPGHHRGGEWGVCHQASGVRNGKADFADLEGPFMSERFRRDRTVGGHHEVGKNDLVVVDGDGGP
jgi:hypothetical protein